MAFCNLKAGSVIGRYKLERFLGRGGFCHVWKAINPETREFVALKIGDVAGGGRYVNRAQEVTPEKFPELVSPDEVLGEAVFFREGGIQIDFLDLNEIDLMLTSEAELLAKCVIGNFVQLKEIIQHQGRPVLVLEYLQGKTIRDKIRNLEPITLNWFLTIVKTLEKLRERGQLDYHGDLKPENLIVKSSGRIVILDPGHRVITTNLITTTPQYNPLLLTNSKADVMAIGIMLYEIITGAVPFQKVPWEYAGTQSGGEVVRLSLAYFLSYQPVRDLNSNCDEALEKIIRNCIFVPSYGLQELRAELLRLLQSR